ncbi:MAG: glutathione S-transferase family protein [Parvibaculaceae bacterium]|nr:glutathione S-transferase family protein [Parvibaculaceae bacterium]
MLKVYHAKNTRSTRVVWLLEELGLPYETEVLEFSPEALQSETYLAINPLAKVPSLTDGDLILNESAAITLYLLAKYGKGRLEPAQGTRAHGEYLQWLIFAEASFMPPLSAIAQHSFIRPEEKRVPLIVAEGQADARKIIGLIDRALAGKAYIAGAEFTAADTMLGYNFLLASLFGLWNAETSPNVAAWYGRISARPGFQKATA